MTGYIRGFNHQKCYTIVTVKGTEKAKADGVYGYAYFTLFPGVGYYHRKGYKINDNLTEIYALEYHDDDSDDDYGYGYYAKNTIYKKNNDNEWEQIIKEENKNVIMNICATLITIDDTFLAKNMSSKSKMKPEYSLKIDQQLQVLAIKEMIEYDFVNIILSMLFCEHNTLSFMPHCLNRGKSETLGVGVICEKCDVKWGIGTHYSDQRHPYFRPQYVNCIKIAFDLENRSKRTIEYFSLKEKRKVYYASLHATKIK